jgi:hypothetical protein
MVWESLQETKKWRKYSLYLTNCTWWDFLSICSSHNGSVLFFRLQAHSCLRTLALLALFFLETSFPKFLHATFISSHSIPWAPDQATLSKYSVSLYILVFFLIFSSYYLLLSILYIFYLCILLLFISLLWERPFYLF